MFPDSNGTLTFVCCAGLPHLLPLCSKLRWQQEVPVAARKPCCDYDSCRTGLSRTADCIVGEAGAAAACLGHQGEFELLCRDSWRSSVHLHHSHDSCLTVSTDVSIAALSQVKYDISARTNTVWSPQGLTLMPGQTQNGRSKNTSILTTGQTQCERPRDTHTDTNTHNLPK